MVLSSDLILFGLNSKETNEGLPFIESARVQIVKVSGNDDEKKSDDDLSVVVVKEYELQKMKDLNWKFEIMKSQFLDALNAHGNQCKIRMEIEWESGFEMATYHKGFDGLANKINLPETMHSMQLELRK